MPAVRRLPVPRSDATSPQRLSYPVRMNGDEDRAPQDVALEVVSEVFERSGRWPTRQYVEAVLDQDHRLDLEEVLGRAPRALIYATGTQESSEVILTVPGLAAAGATRDVGRFVEALRWCVEAQIGFRPSDPGAAKEVKIEADQFKSEWSSRGEEASELELAKLRAMFVTEGIYSSIGGEDGRWTLSLNRRCVAPYREVRTIEDYLEIKDPAPAEPGAGEALLEIARPEVLAPGSGAVALGLEEVPAKIAEACGTLFAHGHFGAGVLEATKVMRDLLKEASDLELDGFKLAGKALNPDEPRIVVGDLATETGRSRQRGVMLIAQGVFCAVRNPLAHQRIVMPASEARQTVAMIAFVVEAVESRRAG